jgi:hypothetical protein
MVQSSLEVQGDLKFAGVASEKILSAGAPTDGPETGMHFVFNPATGALEIAPQFRRKARKAIMREVGRMKFRLYLTRMSLYLDKFLIEMSCLRLRVSSEFRRHLLKL